MSRNNSQTIDWDEYWEGDLHRFDELFMIQGAHAQAEFLSDVIADRSVRSIASVGCGPATCLFDLAERFPELECVGFDVSERVIRENTARRDEKAVDNLRFETDSLPSLATDEQFDIVYCYATLHYVERIADAIESLFDAVAPGGMLVAHYPNEAAREWFGMIQGETARPPATRFTGIGQPIMNELGMEIPVVERDGAVEIEHPELLPGEDERDALRERFSLVLEGENLLSADEIASITGSDVTNFWKLAGITDEDRPSGHNPCVAVHK